MLRTISETYYTIEVKAMGLSSGESQGEGKGKALSGELSTTSLVRISRFCSDPSSLRNEVDIPAPSIRPAFFVDMRRRSFDDTVPGILDGPAT